MLNCKNKIKYNKKETVLYLKLIDPCFIFLSKN